MDLPGVLRQIHLFIWEIFLLRVKKVVRKNAPARRIFADVFDFISCLITLLFGVNFRVGF